MALSSSRWRRHLHNNQTMRVIPMVNVEEYGDKFTTIAFATTVEPTNSLRCKIATSVLPSGLRRLRATVRGGLQ
jgi:hypothetical protein